MKTNLRTQALLLSATILGALFPSPTSADIVTQTLTHTAGRNWIITPSWGSQTNLPFATNDYVTPAGFDVRTPDSQTASTFLGNSLQIDPGGRFILKNGGAAAGLASGNVKLNGGSMNFNTANANTICAIGGSLPGAGSFHHQFPGRRKHP